MLPAAHMPHMLNTVPCEDRLATTPTTKVSAAAHVPTTVHGPNLSHWPGQCTHWAVCTKMALIRPECATQCVSTRHLAGQWLRAVVCSVATISTTAHGCIIGQVCPPPHFACHVMPCHVLCCHVSCCQVLVQTPEHPPAIINPFKWGLASLADASASSLDWGVGTAGVAGSGSRASLDLEGERRGDEALTVLYGPEAAGLKERVRRHAHP